MADLRRYRDLHTVRLVRNLVRSWWNLEAGFASADGCALDHADGELHPGGNELCRLTLSCREGFRRCGDSLRAVSERLEKTGARRALRHQCHLGFEIAAAPIHFDGQLVGFFYAAGAQHGELSDPARSQLLAKVGELAAVSAQTLSAAPSTVPHLTAADLDRLAELLESGAREVMECYERQGRTEAVPGGTTKHPFPHIVGDSAAMRSVFALLQKVVRTQSTVLIHGESGTGKELIARAIHDGGPRARRPFVVQNCSAFNDNLLESALFGHLRGSFTGAVKDQKGLFEVADGGTFFLDEIGDMSPMLQVKLLRVLQEGTFLPVGGVKPLSVDVRIVAASHKDLAAMVERGEFRQDLYYRINVLRVALPPLRERRDDLPLLAAHFLTKHAPGKAPRPRLSREALAAMRRYSWPGNVRELENEIERAVALNADAAEIEIQHLSSRIRAAAEHCSPSQREPAAGGTLRQALEEVEARVIAQGLVRTRWNKSQLAKELGISRSNLIQKCNYYGLERKN